MSIVAEQDKFIVNVMAHANDGDDDWESGNIEVALGKLKVDTEIPNVAKKLEPPATQTNAPKAPIKLPPNNSSAVQSKPQAKALMVRASGGPPAIKPTQAPARSDEVHFVAGKGAAAQKPKIPIRSIADPLDPAITSALGNHRNRMQLLEVEQTLLQFVRSSDTERVLAAASSSYWRMIFFRVADRFRLEHMISNDGGSVMIRKCVDTSYPKALIADMDLEKEWRASESGSMQSDENKASDSITVTPTLAAAPKVMLMKRGGGMAGGAADPSSAARSKSTKDERATQRDKAYAEARARIMGGDLQDNSPLLSEGTTEIVPDGEIAAGSVSERVSEPGGSNSMSGRSNRNRRGETILWTGGSSVVRDLPPHPQQVSSTAGPANAVPSKAVLRDRQIERSDPDFARHTVNVGMAPLGGFSAFDGLLGGSGLGTYNAGPGMWEEPGFEVFGFSHPGLQGAYSDGAATFGAPPVSGGGGYDLYGGGSHLDYNQTFPGLLHPQRSRLDAAYAADQHMSYSVHGNPYPAAPYPAYVPYAEASSAPRSSGPPAQESAYGWRGMEDPRASNANR